MVCKKSFSAAASTHTEEVSGAEAGRQGKETSEIKELGEGNRRGEEEKQKLPVKPFRGEKGRKSGRKREGKGGKLYECWFASVSYLVPSGPMATKSTAMLINKKMILYFKCSYCHGSSK